VSGNDPTHTLLKQRARKLTFSELTVDLSAENVEQIGWGRHAGDLHIAILVLTIQLVLAWEDPGLLIAQLEPPLHPARRVFWPLPIIPVGQRGYQAGPLQPFHLTRGDELVNDTL
jgi:hypothetical protein